MSIYSNKYFCRINKEKKHATRNFPQEFTFNFRLKKDSLKLSTERIKFLGFFFASLPNLLTTIFEYLNTHNVDGFILFHS